MQRTSSALVCVFVTTFVAGCSSGDFQTAPSTDTGTSADTNDSTIPMCIVPPAATGSEGDLCRALADYYSRCKHCEDCVQTNVNSCISFGSALSKMYKNAFIACKDQIKCDGDVNTIAGDKCVIDHLSPADLSAKQIEAKDKYCALCSTTNKSECDNFFGRPAGTDAGADAGVAGIGSYVVVAGDDSVQTMITDCTNAINCNPALYFFCTQSKFCAPFPKDACGSKFCGK